MHVSQIYPDRTDRFSVRENEWDNHWWLVKTTEYDGSPLARPEVISIIDRPGWANSRHLPLKPTGRLYKRIVAAVQTPSVAEAIKAWHEVSEKYADFGAADTEPRVEFSILMESVDDYLEGYGDIAPVPTSARQWQLFSQMKGSGKAARELTKAARVAVAAAKRDGREALVRALGY